MKKANKSKYLGFTMTRKALFDSAPEEFAGRAEGKVEAIVRNMWSI